MDRFQALTLGAIGCWSVFLAFIGAAFPIVRGGVIVLYLLAIAGCLLSGMFIETQESENTVYYMDGRDRVITALLPGFLIAVVVLMLGVWGIWIAVH
jgi:hypothetical protein